MTKASITTVILILFFNVTPVNAQYPGDPPRERLGARVSFTGTTGRLKNHFGHGYDFTLYFTERIYRSLNLEIQIGATYLGDVFQRELGAEVLQDLDSRFFLPPGDPGVDTEIRFAYLTIGPQYTWPTSETHTWYGSFGLGVYSASALFDTGVMAQNYSNQRFGINVGAGLLWRITDNWNLEVTTRIHKVWTGDYHRYNYYSRLTEGGDDPWLLGLGLGVALDLR